MYNSFLFDNNLAMETKLKEYNKKRDFNHTSEPAGKEVFEKKANLKFVIQYHEARAKHFDFRLEWEGVLLSWAVPKGPSFNSKDKRLAVMVEDHPLDYASFEGLIPKGQYGGGSVMLWDEGTWKPLEDFNKGLKNGSLKFEVFGKRIKGKWALVRLKEENKKENKNWLLIKEKDEYSKQTDGISNFKTSIETGRTTAQIKGEESPQKKKNPFKKVDVQLAKLTDQIPYGEDWLFEVKYDGYRIVCFTEGGKTKLLTRNSKDFTSKFKTIVADLNEFSAGRAIVFDGEIVVSNESGKTDFQMLQNYVKKPDDKPICYIIFDLLALDGKDLRNIPLIERKSKLESLLKTAPKSLVYSSHVVGNGKQCFKAAEKIGFEGIVGKRVDSIYSGNRNGDWIKLKCYLRQEFAILGYTVSKKRATGISAILLGVFNGENYNFVGRAGTGLTERKMDELLKEFVKIKSEKSFFKEKLKPHNEEKIFWLLPKFVAEIQFSEITNENRLRQASFKGIRLDKNPEEVVLEKKHEIKEKNSKKNQKKTKKIDSIIVEDIEITNPSKIIYNKKNIKKIDVINYYLKISKKMFPFVRNRVLSVVRCHKGVNAKCFFKKHPVGKNLGVSIIPIKNSEGEMSDYFYLENPLGLVSEAQLGTIEFHVWGSQVNNLDKPDMMVFDLDPDSNMGLEQIRKGVKDLKNILDGLKLKSFLKTSGGKGYHVVIPFEQSTSWDAFNEFAKRIAQLMESKWPDKYTSNMRKVNRKGKIFIDWVRNGRGATTVAPYSLRARPGACVSMPISWRELDIISPNGIDINEALKRANKKDPWKNFYDVKQKLK